MQNALYYQIKPMKLSNKDIFNKFVKYSTTLQIDHKDLDYIINTFFGSKKTQEPFVYQRYALDAGNQYQTRLTYTIRNYYEGSRDERYPGELLPCEKVIEDAYKGVWHRYTCTALLTHMCQKGAIPECNLTVVVDEINMS